MGYKFNPFTGTLDESSAAGAGISNVVEDLTPQLGGDLDTNGKSINAIAQTNAIENQSKLLQTEDIIADFVVTGLLPATSANLTSDISAGHAYVTGTRVNKAVTSKTYTASKDTYVDVNSAGTYTFVEVALGAAAPAVTADSIRLAKVVTGVDNITGVTDLRAIGATATLDKVVATDASGLLLQDDGGNGITIADGGDVTLSHQLSIAGASRVSGYMSAVQTIVTVTTTKLMMNTLLYDNLNEFDAVTNYRFTAQKAGYYGVTAGVLSDNVAWAAGKYWIVYAVKNGTVYHQGLRNIAWAAVTTYFHSILARQIYLAANDYLEFFVRHSRGSDTNTNTDTETTYFQIHRLS